MHHAVEEEHPRLAEDVLVDLGTALGDYDSPQSPFPTAQGNARDQFLELGLHALRDELVCLLDPDNVWVTKLPRKVPQRT